MNTSDRMVEKVRIHLYFQREYTISPASGRKNEYHRRVSPIVLSGGRSSEIHIATIKLKNTNSPIVVDEYATTVFPFHAAMAPMAHSSTERTAK